MLLDTQAHGCLIVPHGQNLTTAPPEVLPHEVLPLASVSPRNVDGTFALHIRPAPPAGLAPLDYQLSAPQPSKLSTFPMRKPRDRQNGSTLLSVEWSLGNYSLEAACCPLALPGAPCRPWVGGRLPRLAEPSKPAWLPKSASLWPPIAPTLHPTVPRAAPEFLRSLMGVSP